MGGSGSTFGGVALGVPPLLAGMLPPFEKASVRKKKLDGIVKQLREKEKEVSDRAKWTKIGKKGLALVSDVG